MKLTKRNTILLALVLIGLALRLWFVSVNVIDPRFSAADDGDYYQRALRFAATGDYIDNAWLIRPPLHVLMFSAILWLCINLGEPNWGIPLIRLVQIALSLLTIPIGYGLARRLFGQRAGYTFAALMAIWFPMIELPALILSEPLFFFFLLLHLYLLIRWRDERGDGRQGMLLLAGAGASIGLAALARSPALYASAFAIGWLALEAFGMRKTPNEPQPAHGRRAASPAALGIVRTHGPISITSLFSGGWIPLLIRWVLVFCCAIALVIAPWATRNYLAYGRFIPTDTLGPVNLWLALTTSGGEGEGKAILASIPQAERQDFVNRQISEIIRNDPTILLRNLWPHFQHIWKAQFIEDFLVKASFYTRPLRDVWPMGMLSDLLWLVFTVGGLVALAAPLRWRGTWAKRGANSENRQASAALAAPLSRIPAGDGPFRLLALGWIAYSALIVMLIHIEPRYLLPIWLLMALYGSWAVGDWSSLVAVLRKHLFNAILAGALVVAFCWLFFSYRNYPAILTQGWQRERAIAAGQQAYAAGDYLAAERAYREAVALQPGFIDGRTDLALSLVAQGRYDDALVALDRGDTHRANVVRGEIARAQGKDELAKTYFTDAEFRAGEDIQILTLDWLRPPRTDRLVLGNGLDFGYISGFSPGEIQGNPDGSMFAYRWLQGTGRIVLPLAQPLRTDSVLTLHMAGGYGAMTPLQVTMGGQTVTVDAPVGRWRVYQLHIPETLAGQQKLDITLKATTFIPARVYPDSSDTRPLSLMISTVGVQ